MSYLVDTNVISEIVRTKPDANVLQWFENIPTDALHMSVLSLGEIRKGIEGIKDYSRREKLRIWLEIELPEWFGNRIINIDISIVDRWGRLNNEMKRPLPVIDSLIAATALHHELRLVTRNEQDFNYPALEVVNPWKFKS